MSNDLMVQYEVNGESIKLDPATVRTYLVNGNGNVTDQEVKMFTSLCLYQKLNPFLKEAYLIKYGTSPATIITAKQTFLRRAFSNPNYEGFTEGISDDGKTAWAEVYVKGYRVPIRKEVDFEEYVGRTGDGKVNNQWKTKPRTMLKKVALVQALREAFPAELVGMYTEEEFAHNSTPQEQPQPTPEQSDAAANLQAELTGAGSPVIPAVEAIADEQIAKIRELLTATGKIEDDLVMYFRNQTGSDYLKLSDLTKADGDEAIKMLSKKTKAA